jgi:hypothetical protein
MIVKTSIGFLMTNSDPQLIVDVQSAITGITGNPNFATPTPTLAIVTTALNAFTVALADAANGGLQLTAIKNAKRVELVSLMRQLASYVTITSNGDLAVLLSSGLPIQKPARTPIGVLPAPETPILKQGALTGEIDASTPPVPGAYAYNWRVALAPTPTVYVQTDQTTGARNTFPGLVPGQVYNVELNALGSAGPSDWSNAAELRVV